MATISSAGAGSGIDISALVSSIVAAEAKPATLRLDQQESRFLAKLTGLGSLKSALSSFKSALTSLTDLTPFQARTATSASTALFTASATSAAVPGSFSVEVTSLAAAHKLASIGFAGTSAAIGSGSMTIGSGANTFTVSIGPTANTVGDVRDAINDAADNTSVAATVINVDDGTGGTETKLLLTASAAGTANEIRITVVDDDGTDTDANGLSRLVYDPLPAGSGTENLSVLRAAADAQIKIDQQTVTASGNTITDAIEGVTLTLVSADPGNPADLTVSADKGSAVSSVNTFVASYNNVRKVISDLSRFDADTATAGILLGDATLRTVSTQLRSELGEAVPGLSGAFSTLAELGVTTGADGSLSVDAAALDAALDADFDAVGELFAATGGVAVRLGNVVESYVRFDGIIDVRTNGLQVRVDDITSRREVLDRRLAALEERLLGQFIAMDSLISNLRTEGDFLTRQFTALQSLGRIR